MHIVGSPYQSLVDWHLAETTSRKAARWLNDTACQIDRQYSVLISSRHLEDILV